MLLMVIDERSWKDRARGALEALLDAELMLPGNLVGFRETMDQQVKKLVDGSGTPTLMYLWDDPGEGGSLGPTNSSVIYTDGRNKHGYRMGPGRVIDIHFRRGDLKPNQGDRIRTAVEVMRRVVDVVRPKFALLDDHAEAIQNYADQDLRTSGWGAMVFGPDMIKEVGRQRILACPLFLIKEELDWGGIWTQTWAKPFITDWRLRQDVAKWLGLKELYGETVEAE